MTKTYVKTNNTEARHVKLGYIIAGKEYEVTDIVEYRKHKTGFIELESLYKGFILIGTGCAFLEYGLWEVVER